MHRQIAGRLTGPVTKWVVLGGWIVILAVMAPFAGKLTDVQNNQTDSWLPSSAESVRALDHLPAAVDKNDVITVVLYQRDGGLSAADFQQIDEQGQQIQQLDGVKGQVSAPTSAQQGASAGLVSPDGELALTLVTFNFGDKGWNALSPAVDDIKRIATIDGVTTYVTGQGGLGADQADAFEGIDGTLLYATIGVVIVILLLTYRSPVLWLLPVISAGASLLTAEGVIYLLAKHAGLVVNAQSQGILTVLVFGAGTDYALLLVARYREELRRHENRHEAMAVALHRAASAIVASAATVVLGMLCLLVAEMNSTSGLGPVAAVGIAVGLVVMLTLLPALLVITGRWVFWPARPAFGSAEPTASGVWARVGRFIKPRPRAVWGVTVGVLLIACLGLLTLDTRGLTESESFTKKFDSIRGQDILLAHGMADQSNPVQIVADTGHGDEVVAALAGIPHLSRAAVTPTTATDPAFVQADIDAPAASATAYDVVKQVRAALAEKAPDAHALVTGGSAMNYDVKVASAHDTKVIIPLILLVVMVILMVLLRAVLAPVVLVATVVLSFGAALGIATVLFTKVFGFAAEDPSYPLFVFVFLVALGIDYNIFLMTRVREETPTHGTRQASLTALSATGGVITSAGLVLASTFAVLGTLPIVTFVEIGVAVAIGVILDTLIVRSILVTSLNLDIGGRIWWPSRLDRHRTEPSDVRVPVGP